jgi:hypothetical protein
MEMWNGELLKVMENGINKFINFEEKFNTKVGRRMIRILVEVD